MLPHPFGSTRRIIAAGVIMGSAVAALGGLLVLYGDIAAASAFADAVVFLSLLGVCGMLSWFILGYIRIWQTQLAVNLLAQIVCLGVCFVVLVLLFEAETAETFGKTLPLRLIIGMGTWSMLMQWYVALQRREEVGQRPTPTSAPMPTMPTHEEPPAPSLACSPQARGRSDERVGAAEPAQWLERISVKAGGRIHIIYVKDLYCIEACGDYANLFTHEGQYVKEQTMKYFETHLPPLTFVRIHRSAIVNIDHILRVELFGKESWQVRLRNGHSLKVSLAGYKLLKERLNL